MRALILWTVFHVFFVSVLFGCLACGGSRPPIEMDAGVRPHFDRFMALCDEHGTVRYQERCKYAGEFLRSIKIVDEFEEYLPQAMAICIREKNLHTIELRREDWQLLSFESKSRLLGHELGHCVLGLDHTPFGLMTEVFPRNEMPTDELIIEAVGEKQ